MTAVSKPGSGQIDLDQCDLPSGFYMVKKCEWVQPASAIGASNHDGHRSLQLKGQEMRTQLLTIICAALIGVFALTSPVLAQQKSVKACESEWRTNKAEYQAKGITQKAYVAQCRAGGATTAPAPAATTAPTTSATAARPAPAATKAPTGANQFSTEAQAKARCPTDTVVWVNLSSGIYHFPGHKTYGQTKKGAYMCERDTATAGFHAAKNEKHP